jgi:arylsulfatase
MADQQRFDQAGFAGRPGSAQYLTPNLDGLAAAGTVFEQAYSVGTTCVPGRVGLLTGVQPHRVPPAADGMSPPEGIWTVARALREAGYETALVGKMHLLPIHGRHGFETMRMCEHPDALSPGRAPDDVDDYRQFLLDDGLVDWRDLAPVLALDHDRSVWGGEAPLFPYDGYYHPTEWIVRAAARVLARRDPSRPLFLVVSFLHPHAPYNPLERYVRRFHPDDAVLPADGFELNDRLPPAFREALSSTEGPYQPALAPAAEEMGRRLITLMRAMMAHVDDGLGRVLRRIDQSRTVVAYTADHGDYGGHRGLVRKVPWIPFDDLARVPLVVRAPGGAPGVRVGSLVQSSDLVPTFLDYAGVPGPDHDLDSRSLRADVDGVATAFSPAGDRPVFCATNQGWPMVRRGSMKLIDRGGQQVLFDLADDPHESLDRSGDRARRGELDDLRRSLLVELARPAVAIDQVGSMP